MSERPEFDLVDLELLKESPQRWSVDYWRLMGQCEMYLRDNRYGDPRKCFTQMQLMVRQAMKAHAREQTYCPWDDNYVRKPFYAESENIKPTTAEDHVLLALHHATGLGVKRKDLTAVVVDAGYKPTVVSMVLSRMEEAGHVKRVDHGVYGITPAGRKTPIIKAALA